MSTKASPIPIISITREQYSDSLIELRNVAYGQNVKGEDDFDRTSKFVVARRGAELVGSVRITPSLHGPLNAWFAGKCHVKPATDCVDLSRAVVAPQMRRSSVFKMMMIHILQTALMDGACKARAALAPGSKHYGFLNKVGFEIVGGIIAFNDHQLPPCEQNVICCDLGESSALWKPMSDAIQRNGKHRYAFA